MSSVQLDDGYPEHPKVVGLSDAALAMEIRAMCYSARRSTDGFLPDGCLRLLTGAAGAQKVADELVGAGRWERDDERSGYWIHGYLEHNPSTAQQRARRAAAAVRMRRSRARSRAEAAPPAGSPAAVTQPPLPGADPVTGSGPAAAEVAAELLGAAGRNGHRAAGEGGGQAAATGTPVPTHTDRTAWAPDPSSGPQVRPAPAATSPEGPVSP